MTTFNHKKWDELKEAESYKLSQAQFKGMVIQGMQDIRICVKDNKSDIKDLRKENKTDYKDLQKQVNGIKLISAVMGGIAGIVTAVLGLFAFRKQ